MTAQLSLRTRLLLAAGMIALVALVIADFAVYVSLRSYLFTQEDSTLQASELVVSHLASPPSLITLPAHHPASFPKLPHSAASQPSFCALGREAAPGLFIEVRKPTGQIVNGEQCPAFQSGSKSYSPELPAVLRTSLDVASAAHLFGAVSTNRGGPPFRVVATQLPDHDTLVVAGPISEINNTLRRLLLVELLVTAGALIVGLLLGLWLVRVGLRPLKDVERTAEAITGGDLEHRVPNANLRTEVGHVATALNVMLERIEVTVNELRASEGRFRRFASDASHELRTPIAAVSAYAQLFDEGAADNPDDTRRVIKGIQRESGRMTRLVEDLLLLERLEEDQLVDLVPVELVGIASEAIETALIVGPQWTVSLRAGDSVEVLGDPVALRQVIDNLLANVRAHTPAGTLATLRVVREGDAAVIEVADNGPGLAEEQSELVFERFFRADPSRSRRTGGAGLGLAIVATIIAMHGGRISASSRPGEGATFRINLPSLEPDGPNPE